MLQKEQLMSEEMKPPILEHTKVIFDAGYGRCLANRAFKSLKGISYDYKIWWHSGSSPSIVFPLTVDRKVIAIKEFRHGMADFSLEFPGGLPCSAESELSEETGRRELLEETGYKAGRIIRLACDPWVETQTMNLRYYPFLAFDCTLVEAPRLEETEVMQTVLIPLEEWYGLVFEGRIVCNATIAHSMLALPYLLSGDLKFT